MRWNCGFSTIEAGRSWTREGAEQQVRAEQVELIRIASELGQTKQGDVDVSKPDEPNEPE